MNETALRTAVEASRKLLYKKAYDNFKTFVKVTKSNYVFEWFHEVVADKLEQFAKGNIKNMMILMPPQHGKSELATRRLTPWMIGRNPNLKIAIASYNDTFVQGFSRNIQNIIDSRTYHDIFPGVMLAGSEFAKKGASGSASKNLHEFDIIGHEGKIKTVGRGGSLTGSTVDIGIIDDLYKDRQEAMSLLVSAATWTWYTDVFKTRLHNNSQQLIMNTRWDRDDLAGRLIMQESDQWEIITFPAIKTQDDVPYDTRTEGEALYPARHSLERLLDIKKKNQVTFNSLYQQDPKPDESILIFPNWVEVPDWPMFEVDKNGVLQYIPYHITSWGLDFGKTTGINALVRTCINGEDIYFDEYLYEPGVATKYIAQILRANGYKNGQPVYCDHIPTKIAELRRLQINAYPAIKGEGSIQAGIDKLKEFICHYTKRSVNIRMETGLYQKEVYGTLITNVPVDAYNHLMDACRYSVYSMSFRPKK